MILILYFKKPTRYYTDWQVIKEEMRGWSTVYLHQQELASESRYSRGSTTGRTLCLHLTVEQKPCSLLSVP